jgi:HD-GYP domain-containing protein (c-di-GMP phosphodiesterase class II)
VDDSGDNGSLFSQRLDRTAFVAYFMGAIVPLSALVFIVQRYVLPSLPDGHASTGLIAMISSMAILTSVSYLVLRRTTHASLSRMDRDNERLATLLEASRTLTTSEQAHDIGGTAANCALGLSDSSAAYLLIRGKDDELPPELFGTAGAAAERLFERWNEPLLVQARLALENGRPAVAAACRSTDKPALLAMPLDGEDGAMGVLALVHRDTENFDEVQIDAIATLAGLASVAMRNADLRDAQRNFFSHMTEILVSALDAHIGYQGGHGNRVAQIANRIGRSLDLDSAQLQNLHFASRLHDIGMLKFDRTLQKSPSVCEKHAALGSRMLSRIRLWETVAPIVHSHHEWFDGTGYPEEISGDDIPLESRIIAVCDAFDSMTSDTSYQIALPLETALSEIRNGAGTQFDPQIVEAFLTLHESGEIT